MTKQALRAQMKECRAQLSPEQRRAGSARIFAQLAADTRVRQAQWIFSYVSYGTEVDTVPIIDFFLKEKKGVAVPRVIREKAGSAHRMEFYQITSLDALKPGYRGILEPQGAACVPAREGVMLVPGIAFDAKGNRLGYGGGFYDRYLARGAQNLFTIGLAFAAQMVPELPAERYDWAVDRVLTEEGWC